MKYYGPLITKDSTLDEITDIVSKIKEAECLEGYEPEFRSAYYSGGEFKSGSHSQETAFNDGDIEFTKITDICSVEDTDTKWADLMLMANAGPIINRLMNELNAAKMTISKLLGQLGLPNDEQYVQSLTERVTAESTTHVQGEHRSPRGDPGSNQPGVDDTDYSDIFGHDSK